MRATLFSLFYLTLLGAHAQAATFAVPENVAPWGLTQALPAEQRGIYADLADAVAHRTRSHIDIRFVPYGRMLEGVRSGEFDYTFGVVSPLTAAAAPFTATIAQVPMIVVARKGLSLKSLADLHNFADVGYLRGGSCGTVIESDRAIHVVGQDSYETAIRKLATGRLDGLCSIKAGFVYTLRTTGMGSQLGDRLEYGSVAIGLQVTRAKLNTAEANEVGAAVDGLVKDGTVGKIFSRYVGPEYSP